MDTLVNNMDNYIEEISNSISLNSINNFLLTNYEIEVLDRYNIDYNNCTSLKDVLFLIDEILNNSTDEMNDLEEISISIGDRDYYQSDRK